MASLFKLRGWEGGTFEVTEDSSGNIDLVINGTTVSLSDISTELEAINGLTSTSTELNLLDGSSATAPVASTAAILDSGGDLRTASNVGAAGTGVTAVEYGDGHNHTTVLTLSGVAATIGDAAALAGGALIYTFPAGPILVNSATINAGITLTTGTPTTDTPEVGLGTTQGTGVQATLGDVGAAAENILGPATANDIAGTAELLTQSSVLAIETAGDHTVYFNYADTWANVDDTAATIDGTVVINWSNLSA